MATFNRRGSYSEFSIHKNDAGLKTALRMLDEQGKKMLDGFMAGTLQEKTQEVKKLLKKQAGALASVRTPAWGGYKKSTNIYVKVANALKVHKLKPLEYTVHTGDTIQEARVGVEAQRGGRIAHIVAKGMRPFQYGNLPMLVHSSTRWYKSTNARSWSSVGMRMRRTHPGFKDTFDYIGEIENKAKAHFEKHSENVIFAAAIKSGFYTPLGASKAASGGSNLRSSTGGTGIMAARG